MTSAVARGVGKAEFPHPPGAWEGYARSLKAITSG